MTQINKIMQNFRLLNLLKQHKRTGWLRAGLTESQCESVAEHSFGTALLGFMLACEFYPELDASKVMLLGLIHDLGEGVTGDVLPWDKQKIADFNAWERQAALQTMTGLQAWEPLRTLYDEYYAGETSEARLTRQVDKLEMLLQAFVYEEETGIDLTEFYDNFREGFFTAGLQNMLEFVLRLRTQRKP